MNRQHIHLSEDFPGSKSVISGMRANCEIAIYIDVKKAMQDGIKFYRSANNVILSPGDENGFLKPKYFLKIVDIKTSKTFLKHLLKIYELNLSCFR
jgi:2'-phosphotransferase